MLLHSIRMAQSLAVPNALDAVNGGKADHLGMIEVVNHLKNALAAAQELDSTMAQSMREPGLL